jgi:hypothetical protein
MKNLSQDRHCGLRYKSGTSQTITVSATYSKAQFYAKVYRKLPKYIQIGISLQGI